MMHAVETLVVGAGQAGLAVSRCLTGQGADHVVVERGRIAERWRTARWDSLRLLTPSWMTRLPALVLASDLVPAREPELRTLGRSLTSRLRPISDDVGDAHHRRRLLVQDLADLLVNADPGAALLIVLEDLHWAHELSLDVLGHLAGRLATRPTLVVGAYRSDELYSALPMRELRARLLGQRLAEEIRLPRLGRPRPRPWSDAVLGHADPVVAAIHQRSDGIPLHVEEFLAAIGEGAVTPQSGAVVQAAAVPDTLSDAVLSRARRLAARTREVASAAAVIGRSFGFDLLTAITDAGPDEVAAALRELQGRGRLRFFFPNEPGFPPGFSFEPPRQEREHAVQEELALGRTEAELVLVWGAPPLMTPQSVRTGTARFSSRCCHLCYGMMSRCQNPQVKGDGRRRVPGGSGRRRACAAGVPSWRRWPWPWSSSPGGSRSCRTAAPARTDALPPARAAAAPPVLDAAESGLLPWHLAAPLSRGGGAGIAGPAHGAGRAHASRHVGQRRGRGGHGHWGGAADRRARRRCMMPPG